MANRVFVCAVLALWVGSMSWLMVTRVLPSFHKVESPVTASLELGKPVAWEVSWSGHVVGRAASIRWPGVQHTTNLENRVVLEDVPLLELAPPWMRSVVGDIGRLKFDAYTQMEFDSLDNFSRFRSSISVNDVRGVLSMEGYVRGSFLELTISSGDLTYSPRIPVPDQSALGEALFPDARLPYMYVGRHWYEEQYNPFRAPSSPVETVEAEVVGVESIQRGDDLERVMRVEFRDPPGPGIPEEARLQAVAWVSPEDGMVVRQDAKIANSTFRFERQSDEAAARIGRELLTSPGGNGRGRRPPGGYRPHRPSETARMDTRSPWPVQRSSVPPSPPVSVDQ